YRQKRPLPRGGGEAQRRGTQALSGSAGAIDLRDASPVVLFALDSLAFLIQLIRLLGPLMQVVAQGIRIKNRERVREEPFVLADVIERRLEQEGLIVGVQAIEHHFDDVDAALKLDLFPLRG